MSELYRDYIDGKADEIINALGGTITPAPANAELYRDFLDRKFDDVINAIGTDKLIKSLSYTGTGSYSNNIIEFPVKPNAIIGITGTDSSTGYTYSNTSIIVPNVSIACGVIQLRTNGKTDNLCFCDVIDDTHIKLRNAIGQSGYNFNTQNDEYYVYYI